MTHVTTVQIYVVDVDEEGEEFLRIFQKFHDKNCPFNHFFPEMCDDTQRTTEGLQKNRFIKYRTTEAEQKLKK